MIIVYKKYNLATTVPSHLTVYEFLTELNLDQLTQMKEIVKEIELTKLRDKYLREDYDCLIEEDAYYRWEFNECYDEGAEQLWYTCKDYFYEGMDIVIHRDLIDELWSIHFASILKKNSGYTGDTSHYLKDSKGIIFDFKDINNAVKCAEEYIRKNKNILQRSI